MIHKLQIRTGVYKKKTDSNTTNRDRCSQNISNLDNTNMDIVYRTTLIQRL